MEHFKYEFTDRADMLKELKAHFTTDEDGNETFSGGHIVELGFKSTYDEKTEKSTIVSGYLVDVLWNVEPPRKASKEVIPTTPDHYFSGLKSVWEDTKDKLEKE